MEAFSRIYGTHYVLREHRVARIVLTISIDRWSDNTLQKLRANLKAGASLPLAGGELKASIQNDLKEADNRKTVNVDLSTVGGTGLQGFGDVVKVLLSNTQDFQASVGDKVASLLKGFTRDNSGSSAVTVASYEEFGWRPNKLKLWNDLFENKRQRCAELYYAGRQVERDIRRLAIPNADLPLRKKLERYAGKYDVYLAQLAIFQRRLLDKDKSFISKAFPSEPEVDNETYKLLIARFNTLESRMDQLGAALGDINKAQLTVKTVDARIYSRMPSPGNGSLPAEQWHDLDRARLGVPQNATILGAWITYDGVAGTLRYDDGNHVVPNVETETHAEKIRIRPRDVGTDRCYNQRIFVHCLYKVP
jgi:hypothetical protein